MNWLEFVASIIGSLAWPGVVLVVLWYNRHRLANLPDWIDELTLPGGAKVKFARALKRAEEASGKLLASEGRDVANVEGQVAPPKPMVDLAQDHPNAAIVAIFEEIEKIIHQMARFLPLPTKGRDPLSVMYELVRRGYLDLSALRLYQSLAEGRDAAVRARYFVALSAEDAVSYLAAAQVLKEQLINTVLPRLEVDNPRKKEWGSD
jgi:hypothetical protein